MAGSLDYNASDPGSRLELGLDSRHVGATGFSPEPLRWLLP